MKSVVTLLLLLLSSPSAFSDPPSFLTFLGGQFVFDALVSSRDDGLPYVFVNVAASQEEACEIWRVAQSGEIGRAIGAKRYSVRLYTESECRLHVPASRYMMPLWDFSLENPEYRLSELSPEKPVSVVLKGSVTYVQREVEVSQPGVVAMAERLFGRNRKKVPTYLVHVLPANVILEYLQRTESYLREAQNLLKLRTEHPTGRDFASFIRLLGDLYTVDGTSLLQMTDETISRISARRYTPKARQMFFDIYWHSKDVSRGPQEDRLREQLGRLSRIVDQGLPYARLLDPGVDEIAGRVQGELAASLAITQLEP